MVDFMVERRMIFDDVVSKIGAAWSPVEAELALGFTIAEPPESYVHGLDIFWQ